MENTQLHVEFIDGVPVALAFDGTTIHARSLKGFMSRPAKKSGNYFFEDLDSFEEFVSRHATANTELWITGNQAMAVIDGHGPLTPADCAFRAELMYQLEENEISHLIEFAKEIQVQLYFGVPAAARMEQE